MNVDLQISKYWVDLFLKREIPVRTWPLGLLSEWERFSFPIRCLDKVQDLATELSGLSLAAARARVKERRRAIQWG